MNPGPPLEATWILQRTLDTLRAGTPYLWSEGGTRSGKTHNETGAAIIYANETGKSLDIVRATNTALKGSVYEEDLLPWLHRLGLYDERRHNKTDQVIRIGALDARLRYYGVDDEQKIRGWTRDVLLMIEANEISDEKRRQLWMRTTQARIVEHNPTIDDDHWIVRLLEPRVATGECVYFHSTYLDNPFLPPSQVREIEAMQYDDPYGWQIYGLGLRGSHPAAVFDDVTLGAFDPASDTVYGVDFGLKSPYVVAEWGWRDANPPLRPRATLYCRPLVYSTHLMTEDVIERLDEIGACKSREMVCDSSEPDNITRLARAGYKARPVRKTKSETGEGFRRTRYNWLSRHRIVVDHEAAASAAVKGELKRCRYKQKPGSDRYTDDVVKDDDHVSDTGAYGAYDRFGKPRRTTASGSVYSAAGQTTKDPLVTYYG